MRAAVVQAPGDLAITELPDPAPRDHEVVVAVDTCGICGTDVHVLDGDYGVVRYPVIPGHEFGGEVVAVGRAVRGLAAGTVELTERATGSTVHVALDDLPKHVREAVASSIAAHR